MTLRRFVRSIDGLSLVGLHLLSSEHGLCWHVAELSAEEPCLLAIDLVAGGWVKDEDIGVAADASRCRVKPDAELGTVLESASGVMVSGESAAKGRTSRPDLPRCRLKGPKLNIGMCCECDWTNGSTEAVVRTGLCTRSAELIPLDSGQIVRFRCSEDA